MVAVQILLTRGRFLQNFETQIFARRYSNTKSEIKVTTETAYKPIAEFYTGKSIFITGGTGFLGKVLVEKLLYSTKLDKIYLLIRDKRGVDVKTRLEYMFENPLFNRIKESNPQSLTKVVPIIGDINLPNFGLSQKEEEILIDKVSVIFHSAATIMFNEPLSVVMKTNFKGTQEALKIAKRIKNVEAFIHMSTAYTHPYKRVLLETIYPPTAALKDVYKFIEKYGDNRNETMKFIKGYPNTYSFSKALSEYFVAENHGNIPTAIIRPSIVSSTITEPVKGWTDNWYGATMYLYNCAKGWNVVTYGDKKGIGDLIPVDYVANLSIISAARLQGSNEVQVYNITSSSENPITWEEMLEIFIKESVRQGHNDVPCMLHVVSKSRKMTNILTIILQKIPAKIADFLLKITGNDPKYVNIMSRVISIRNSLDYFASKSWVIRSDRVRKEFSKLSAEDQKLFPCNPSNIIWSDYIKDYYNGINKYLTRN